MSATSQTDQVTDERVRAATAHWAPRFLANGTDYVDFLATLSRITTWDEWCRQWGVTAAGYEAVAERAEGNGRRLTAAGAWRRAALCWHWGKFLFTEHPDEQRARTSARSPVTRVAPGRWPRRPSGSRSPTRACDWPRTCACRPAPAPRRRW